MSPTFDEKDQEILDRRRARYDEILGPRMGDWVTYDDGTWRRISYIWREDAEPVDIQTSKGGAWYLGDGYVSMSGSLFGSTPAHTLTDTGQTRPGNVWFFHHDWAERDGGVNASMPFRVFLCSRPPTR